MARALAVPAAYETYAAYDGDDDDGDNDAVRARRAEAEQMLQLTAEKEG